MNDTTFQGNGKITYVPVVVNAKPPKQTRADRIRAMTDEELAEFLETLCPSYNWTMALNGMTWFGFLKQEATDVN